MKALVVVMLAAGSALAQPAPDPPSQPHPQIPDPQPNPGSNAGSGNPRVLQLPPDMAVPEVRATASPTVVKLGSPFTLFVTATYGDGVEVNLRNNFEVGPAFEVKPNGDSQDSVANGRHVREWQFQVVAWELGDLVIPPVPVTFTYQGKAAQLGTNPTPIKVIGLLGDADDIKQLRGASPPTPLLSRDWFWLWVSVGAGVLLIGLIWLLVWRSRRRRRVVELIGGIAIPTRRKLDTPAEHALARLLAIEQAGVLDRDDDRKRGYQEMVEVIREYLGARYRVLTYDLTTYELMKMLRPVAPDGECTLVETWLEKCDIVKYGGVRATADTANEVLGDARALVVATQPAATPARTADQEAA